MSTAVLAAGVIATTRFAPEPQWLILLGMGAVLVIPVLINMVPSTANRIAVAGGLVLGIIVNIRLVGVRQS